MPQKLHVCSGSLNANTAARHKISESISINMRANNVPEADVHQGMAEGNISKGKLILVTVLINFYQNRNLTFQRVADSYIKKEYQNDCPA